MLNNPIQSFWHGPSPTVMEQMCVRSYLAHGHEFHLYVYEPSGAYPEGVVLKDASEIIPYAEVFVDGFGGFVNFSNRFRYALLYQKGGWWVDMDTVCLRAFDFSEPYAFSSEVTGNRTQVNTTYIKSLPGAPFLKDCMDFMDTRGLKNLHWGELGVHLISRMIFRNGMERYIQPPQTFCPVSGTELDWLISSAEIMLPDEAYALHWWNELWRRRGLDKSQAFPDDSLYEQFKTLYVPEYILKPSRL